MRTMRARTATAVVTGAATAGLLAGLAITVPAGAASSHTFGSGGQSLTVSVGCSASQTIITKISGSHVTFYARTYGGRPGHWVNGGTSYTSSTATVAQATNHGVHVNWGSGGQTYSGIC